MTISSNSDWATQWLHVDMWYRFGPQREYYVRFLVYVCTIIMLGPFGLGELYDSNLDVSASLSVQVATRSKQNPVKTPKRLV